MRSLVTYRLSCIVLADKKRSTPDSTYPAGRRGRQPTPTVDGPEYHDSK
jgi:hypothetical protein